MDIRAKFSNPNEMLVELTLQMKLETWIEVSDILKKSNIRE